MKETTDNNEPTDARQKVERAFLNRQMRYARLGIFGSLTSAPAPLERYGTYYYLPPWEC